MQAIVRTPTFLGCFWHVSKRAKISMCCADIMTVRHNIDGRAVHVERKVGGPSPTPLGLGVTRQRKKLPNPLNRKRIRFRFTSEIATENLSRVSHLGCPCGNRPQYPSQGIRFRRQRIRFRLTDCTQPGEAGDVTGNASGSFLNNLARTGNAPARPLTSDQCALGGLSIPECIFRRRETAAPATRRLAGESTGQFRVKRIPNVPTLPGTDL